MKIKDFKLKAGVFHNSILNTHSRTRSFMIMPLSNYKREFKGINFLTLLHTVNNALWKKICRLHFKFMGIPANQVSIQTTLQLKAIKVAKSLLFFNMALKDALE
jgi:hypothetical protein